MKKIIAIALLIIIVLSLCACGSDKERKINCSNCGESIVKDAAFCEHCGIAVNTTDDQSDDNSKNNIIGIWYNADDDYLEILSDNTYMIGNVIEPEDVYYSGEWKYLKKENFFKFSDNNDSFLKIEIKSDKYGIYIEYGEYKKFYKNEYPRTQIEEDLKSQEEKKAIPCPNFVGQTYAEIQNNKDYAKNFEFEILWQNNTEYDKGVIFEQSFQQNEKLKKGTTITLYVSMGNVACIVPDVYGMTESAAVSKLKSSGFSCVIEAIVSDSVETGLVVKTEPVRSTVVEANSEITVYISKGK